MKVALSQFLLFSPSLSLLCWFPLPLRPLVLPVRVARTLWHQTSRLLFSFHRGTSFPPVILKYPGFLIPGLVLQFKLLCQVMLGVRRIAVPLGKLLGGRSPRTALIGSPRRVSRSSNTHLSRGYRFPLFLRDLPVLWGPFLMVPGLGRLLRPLVLGSTPLLRRPMNPPQTQMRVLRNTLAGFTMISVRTKHKPGSPSPRWVRTMGSPITTRFTVLLIGTLSWPSRFCGTMNCRRPTTAEFCSGMIRRPIPGIRSAAPGRPRFPRRVQVLVPVVSVPPWFLWAFRRLGPTRKPIGRFRRTWVPSTFARLFNGS
jgi:hypothetical protein